MVNGDIRRSQATDCATMIERPETHYAKTADGRHVAFQVLGDGPLDVVLVPPGVNHLEVAWEVDAYAWVFRRLASFSRLILFDHRGTGLSDPLGLSEQPSMEGRAADVLTVLDELGSERAAVVANN